ncbi:hypothetical protein BCR41DRAFT_403657 [Lobosporangium transversale]|uniref:Peptidase S8/S53 domain-containing protein n=1 Tax=Lobosporangium transversale TaxID=64571 RepID=A0A1Y2GSF4_9FUNG|nr:hypothetical protein BCR41DRAFT_403657 [Lobosporangium transversale]ORZ21743.1 hypothetical protein BCR41DRAFT_403657 [Lobosporangium transversale]|eukprot:XP_021882994.1 hypothetical protein BCR41DRAFT_403657 [Lobosporangium transversale]
MKALLRAAADGMQIINLSLGGPGGWSQDREARLADMLARNGTIIVAAMGNEGRMGLFESSSPGVAASVITVASTENEFRSSNYFTVSLIPAKKGEGKTKKGGQGEQNDGESRPILYVGDVHIDFKNVTLVQIAPGTSGKVKSDACSAIKKDLRGKIALIRRGDCVFKQKVANAALANASAVIIMDNVPSDGFAADTGGARIPVSTITLSDGEYLLEMIKEQKKEVEGIKLTAGNGPKKVYSPNGGFLSPFSSMGPDAELNSKPDIAAPGGQIWSTFPIKLGSFASLSGTSMATPYVVGCVALYLEGLPDAERSAESIKAALQNSAQPRQQQTGFKGYAPVTQQGAGLLNMMNVFKSQVEVTPSFISLNDTVNMNSNQVITIRNNGKSPLEYEVEILPAAGLLPFDKNMMVEKSPQHIRAEASAKIAQKSVTVPPGSSVTVDLKFTGPDTDPLKYVVYSGFVRFKPKTSSADLHSIHVPYMGMQGDYKTVNVLDHTFGLRLFDPQGRQLRARSTTKKHGHSGSGPTKVEAAGSISHRINSEPNADTAKDPNALARPVQIQNAMKIVFRMITASKVLVLDLVAAEGDDPYQVKSYGILKNGVARYIPRNDQIEGNAFQVMGWDGQILKAEGSTLTVVDAPKEQTYRLRISLLKHFGDLENDQDFESHLSAPFTL